MDATSKVDCWDWTYLVGTIKYGREWKPEKAKTGTTAMFAGEQTAYPSQIK
jgi:hypothetical protein